MPPDIRSCFSADNSQPSFVLTKLPYLAFCVFGISWILLSDIFLLLLRVPDTLLEMTSLQIAKGILFVLISAMMFYFFGARLGRRLTLAERNAEVLSMISRGAYDLIWRCDADARDFGIVHCKELDPAMVEYALNNHLIHPGDLKAETRLWMTALEKGQSFTSVSRLNLTGEFRHYRNDIFPVTDESGAVVEWVGACRDIHEQTVARESLARSEEMLRLAAEAGSVGIWEWDQGLDVLTVSEEMERQVGSKLNRPGDLRQFIHKEDYPTVRRTMLEAKRYSTPFEIEYRVESADGDTRWILNKGTTLCRTTESSRHMVGVSIDISRTKRSEEKYRYLAHHDPLTSLPNRRKMKQWLRQFSESKQAGNALLGIVGIDYFSRINDVYGQDVGNSLLKQVANRLAEHVQAADFVCRYGADTFLIVHSIEDVDCPQKRFSQLLYSISKSYDIDGLQLKAGFSSGLITLNEFGFDWQESINCAETAMARSKSSRRGSITVYEESMAKISARFETVRNELHHAIERDELYVVFQPLMEISNSSVTGFEALVRWDSPRLGSVSPVEFIPLAETTGLIDAVSTVVLKNISSQIRDWKRRGYCVPPIGFNLSPSTLENVDGAEKFLIQLETYGLCPGDLVLEFTETAVIHNEEVVAENIRVLARHGFRIALDDFGTGYSSLENLYKLHISKLKIDKSFVFKIKGSVKHANIVRGLISMARSIDLDVIAEGVESEDQLEMLREWGCDMAQGYIFAKPMLPADAERYLEVA